MVIDFTSGGTISVQDHTDIVNDINTIYGLGTGDKGYGGKSKNVVSVAVDLPLVVAGDVVENEAWIDVRNAMDDCAEHQGSTLPNVLPQIVNLEDQDEIGFSITADPNFSSLNGTPPNNVTTLTTNRANIDILNRELITKLSSSRSTAWGTGNPGEPVTITHEFTATFTDSDHARHFFNTGGSIRFAGSRSSGTVSAQNQAWTDLLSLNSPYIFTGVEYFALTASFVEQDKFFADSATTYGNPVAPEAERNRWIISAKRDDGAGPNGGNGSILRFKTDFSDGFLGPTADDLGTPTGPVGGLPDLVDGNINIAISHTRSIEYFTIASPTYLTTIELNI
jgi:hypothetical protein